MSQPASSAAAAAEEELAAWEDVLDVDDSDLRRRGPASSLSPLRSSSAASRLEGRPASAAVAPRHIPSPAASLVHEAARLRSTLLRSTASGDGQAADPDFSLASWLHALGSLGEGRAWKRQEIAAIRGDRALYRARLVVGMVTSCTPNRLGDLFLSIKDPSGTIGASVHQKVFTKEDGVVVSVGSVIVLKKVAVFRPSNKACYLNITQENLELLVPKDFGFPSKQVVPSSPSENQHPETMNSSCQGDNHIRRIGAETYGETTASAVRDSTFRIDKGSTQGVENHQDMRLEEKDINPSNKNMPSYSPNQQSQKTINSISPANCQQRRGSPCKYASSRAQNSTNDIMMRLLGGERIAPSNKKTAIIEVSCDHADAGTPDANSNTSRMDGDFSDSSGQHHGIEQQTLMECLGSRHILNYNGEEHHQQRLDVPENPNARCSQPSLGGCSLMSKTGDSIEASSDEKLSRPVESEWMLPSSKKLRTDAVLPDNVMSNMNFETHGLANNLNTGLNDVAQEVHVEHASIKKPNECQQKNFITETLGSVLPTQENSSAATSEATAVSASLHSQPNKLVSVASVTEWTDDQLSELFLDY